MEAAAISGKIFNVGSIECLRILDLADRVRDASASSSQLEFVAYEDVYGLGIEDTLHREPSIEKIGRRSRCSRRSASSKSSTT